MSPFVYTEIVLNLLRLSSRTYQGNRGLLGNLLNIEDVYTRCCDERLIKDSAKKMCTRKTSLSNVTNIELDISIVALTANQKIDKNWFFHTIFHIIRKKKKKNIFWSQDFPYSKGLKFLASRQCCEKGPQGILIQAR